jgi:DNA-binding MarR family transcriptional regulator
MKDGQINQIRAFNRFYTRMLGLLDRYILDSQFTLSEVRILYELATSVNVTASDLIDVLDIDKGYLSRMLTTLKAKKLIQHTRSKQDGRSIQLSLTKIGRKQFDVLNNASNKQLAAILEKVTDAECRKLVNHMNQIMAILSKTQ